MIKSTRKKNINNQIMKSQEAEIFRIIRYFVIYFEASWRTKSPKKKAEKNKIVSSTGRDEKLGKKTQKTRKRFKIAKSINIYLPNASQRVSLS